VLRVKVSLVQLVGMVAIVLVLWYVFTMEVFGMKVEERRESGLEKFLNIYVGKVTWWTPVELLRYSSVTAESSNLFGDGCPSIVFDVEPAPPCLQQIMMLRRGKFDATYTCHPCETALA